GELNFFALEIMAPEDASEPLEVEARICARNDFSGAAKLTAQAGADS
ncbi:hypothetical protein HP532_31275, partial [Pseudomonas sp. CrR25]|nr:hypothetical protein [Pseudomonas sp. CrR25]